jgi:hypothetical protein
MRPPMDVMRNCLDDLLASWGIDVTVQKSLTRPALPITDPSNWLDSSDYPARMVAGGYNDQVDFRLTIDAAGEPTACNVLTMESRPEFIKATCGALMRHAHSQPALDTKGNPVPSIYVNSVKFVIP